MRDQSLSGQSDIMMSGNEEYRLIPYSNPKSTHYNLDPNLGPMSPMSKHMNSSLNPFSRDAMSKVTPQDSYWNDQVPLVLEPGKTIYEGLRPDADTTLTNHLPN